MKAFLGHYRGLDATDRLLVHHHAGESRSLSVAIGMLIDDGVRPEDAFASVKAPRPAVIPNRPMIRQLDVSLGLDGQRIDLVSRHYASPLPEAWFAGP